MRQKFFLLKPDHMNNNRAKLTMSTKIASGDVGDIKMENDDGMRTCKKNGAHPGNTLLFIALSVHLRAHRRAPRHLRTAAAASRPPEAPTGDSHEIRPLFQSPLSALPSTGHPGCALSSIGLFLPPSPPLRHIRPNRRPRSQERARVTALKFVLTPLWSAHPAPPFPASK